MTAGSIAVPRIIPLRAPLPGKSKHEIDTDTPIEIKSDTPNVDIYYTLDGNKPQQLKKSGSAEKSTLKYKTPFTLHNGKVTVKALAITGDGRESGIVTKVFLVEYVSSNTVETLEDDGENFLKDCVQELSGQEIPDGLTQTTAVINTNSSQETKSAWEETTQKYQESKRDGSSHHKTFKGARFLKSHLGALGHEQSSGHQSHRSQFPASIDVGPYKSLSNTQTMRVLRASDFLKCTYCLASRPSDPFARFCQECGSSVPRVPGSRLPSPEGAQMGLCKECKTMVPLNTPTCIVCEASITSQLQPQASIHLKDKIICGSCGTGNPANIHICVTCEKHLSGSPTLVSNGDSSPRLPSRDGKMLACSKCGRVNNTDARFCDWCGAKPFASTSYLSCLKCGGMNHPYANFCGSCGAYLEPPARLDPRNSMLFSTGQSTIETTDVQSATWQPMAISSKFGLKSNKVDQGTQTVGLFYPSCKVMEKKEIEIVSQREKREKMSDRRPLLTAISPGRGFWRKQLDHICAHLRSYAQNNIEFRALIGEPQMGKIISAMVHEDGYELSLSLNFILAGDQDLLTGKSLTLSEKNITEGRDNLNGSHTDLEANKKPNKAKTLRPVATKEDRLQPDDRQLLKEVGPNSDGKISVIQELLDKGADPNCSNNENRPVLTVAVLNQHHEAIPVLVQKGADIEQESGPLNNTALHEAAELGAKGVKCVNMLLGCNASLKKKNDKALTAFDLAVKTGNDQLVSLFTAKLGQGMLDKITKPKRVGLDVY